MRKRLFLSLFVAFNLLHAFCADLAWIKQIGGPGRQYGAYVASDNVGNVFLGSTFSGLSFINTNAFNGTNNAILAKFTATGQSLWTIQTTGSSDQTSVRVATDSQGNCYWLGRFSRTMSLAGITLTASEPFLYVTHSAFLAKIAPTGELIWLKEPIKGGDVEFIRAFTCNDDVIYLAATCRGTLTFGTNQFSFPDQDRTIFGKLDQNGDSLWAQVLSDQTFLSAIATDKAANLYITGRGLFSNVRSNMFIARLSTLGEVIWAKGASAPFPIEPVTLTTKDATSGIYLAINCGPISYDDSSPISFDGTSFSLGGGLEPEGPHQYGDTAVGLILKLDSEGNLLWSKSSSRDVYLSSLAICSDNKLAAVGFVYRPGQTNQVYFGTNVVGQGSGAFIAFFAVDGGFSSATWTRGSGQFGEVTSGPRGSAYWTGTLSDTTYFRDLPLPLMIAGPGSNSDVFLAQAFNPTNQPDRSLAIYNAAELEFPTHVGERYQLQSSIDLVNWTNLGSIIEGNGQPYATFQQTRDKSPLFYRLTLAP